MPSPYAFGFFGLTAGLVIVIPILLYQAFRERNNRHSSGNGSRSNGGGNASFDRDSDWGDSSNSYDSRQRSSSTNQRHRGRAECKGCEEDLRLRPLHPPFSECRHIYHADCVPRSWQLDHLCPNCAVYGRSM